jgi:hypothetical protein
MVGERFGVAIRKSVGLAAQALGIIGVGAAACDQDCSSTAPLDESQVLHGRFRLDGGASDKRSQPGPDGVVV